MRRYLLTAPQWILTIIYGVSFACWMVFFGLIVGGSSTVGTMVGGVLGGVVFGALIGSQSHDWNQQAREFAGPLTDDEFSDAARAAQGGAIPTDPRIREAAARLVQFRLAEHDAQRLSRGWFAAVATVGFALGAVFHNRWWALAALIFAITFIDQQLLPNRLMRRLDLLEAASATIVREGTSTAADPDEVGDSGDRTAHSD
jgi:hypothetical protein